MNVLNMIVYKYRLIYTDKIEKLYKEKIVKVIFFVLRISWQWWTFSSNVSSIFLLLQCTLQWAKRIILH